MGVVDFEAWARPDLELPLRGRTFRVRPPSVEASGQLLACAVRGEINLGIIDEEFPAELQAVLDTIKPGTHPALGDTYAELVEAGVDQVTIDRMAYYAVYYWTRGPEYALQLARVLWTPRDVAAGLDGGEQGGDGAGPKAS